MDLPPIPLDRSFLGARPGVLTNPTFGVFGAALLFVGAGTVGYLRGALPAPLVIAVNAIGVYLFFTVLHESVHGVAHRSRTVNAILGRIAALPLAASYPWFRGVHFEHHSHTNDAARDPDWIPHRPLLAVPLFALVILITYRIKFYSRRLFRARRDLYEALLVDLLFHGAILASVALGRFTLLFVLWLGPALAAALFLGIVFDFVPHYPYDSKARYLDTRVFPSRLLNALLLGQNHHLIHHLWTTIPWYRYQRVFASIRPDLERRGARIGWSIEPLPKGVP